MADSIRSLAAFCRVQYFVSIIATETSLDLPHNPATEQSGSTTFLLWTITKVFSIPSLLFHTCGITPEFLLSTNGHFRVRATRLYRHGVQASDVSVDFPNAYGRAGLEQLCAPK
jgi:hypothetical protein